MSVLRVMTFNVRGAYHKEDGENAWERRADLNLETIRRYSPDLIGFQEVQQPNLEAYSQQLPEYEQQRGPKAENEEPHGYNLIMWKPERLQRQDSGGFWLSLTCDRWSASWDTRCIRAANWARFLDTETNTGLLHLNTHLDHISELARFEGTKVILRELQEIAADHLACVVTADFNTNPDSPVYQLFVEAGFKDAHIAAGNPPANTFHGFAGEHFVNQYPGTEARIDWILVREGSQQKDISVRSCSIIRDGRPPIYPSDHYPVLAKLAFSRE